MLEWSTQYIRTVNGRRPARADMVEAMADAVRMLIDRSGNGELRSSRMRLRHTGCDVVVTLDAEDPELLDMARAGEGVETTVRGVPVPAPSLGLLILSSLVAGQTTDLAAVEESLHANRDLTAEGPRQRRVITVIPSHPRGQELVSRYLAIADTVRDRIQLDPDRYAEERS